MTIEDRIQLIREAEAWFNAQLVRCFDIYRLNHLMATYIQNLTRIGAGVQMDLDELEDLDNATDVCKNKG